MGYIIRFYVLLLIVSTNLHAIELTFTVSSPDIQQTPNAHQRVMKGVGEPALNYCHLRILLPHGHRIVSVSCDVPETTTFRDVEIPMVVPDVPIADYRGPLPANEAIYEAAVPYPHERVRYLGTGRYAGFDIGMIDIFHDLYNPAQKELIRAAAVTLRITTIEDVKVALEQTAMICLSDRVIRRMQEMVINPDIVYSYPSSNTVYSTRNLVEQLSPHDMMIITTEPMMTVLSEYADWRTGDGVPTVVVPIEAIFDEYSDEIDPAANLRAFVKDVWMAWASSAHPLEYVILAGDGEAVPFRGCWGTSTFYGTLYDMPCDIYMGSLDGDWNANANDVYGETDDAVDYYPEIAVGRFPADSVDEMRNIINKIKISRDYPTAYLDHVLAVGEQLSDVPTWGGTYLNQVVDHTAYIPDYFEVTKLYDMDGTFSTQAVLDHIMSDGSALIFHLAHTNYFYLFGIDQQTVDSFTNTEYPLFWCGGCHNLAFDQATSGNAESVGEHCLTAENAMSAFIGHSRYGYTTNIEYLKDALRNIFTHQEPAWGQGLRFGLADNADLAVQNDLYRYEHYTITMAGDPSIPLQTGLGMIPDIDLYGTELTEREGNGNQVPEPGEILNVNVTIGCLPGNGYAANTSASLFAVSGGVTIINGLSLLGDIESGNLADTHNDPFVISVNSDYAEDYIELILEIETNPGQANHFRKRYPFTLPLVLSVTDEDLSVPTTSLRGIYPNPFNPETRIEFSLNRETEVTLVVFNARGQRVRVLADNALMREGIHRLLWNGKDRLNRDLASGVYFVTMEANGKTLTRKMMLLR